MPPETAEQTITPEARLRAVIDEAEALSRRRGPSADELRALDTLLAEGETLRTQIAQAGRTASLREWAGGSAGMLPLADTQNPEPERAQLPRIGESRPPIQVQSTMGNTRRSYSVSGDPRDVSARLEGLEEAGYMVVRQVDARHGRRHIYGVELLDDEGPGWVDDRTARAISTRDYHDAFAVYVRGRAETGHLRVLQEGIDTSGGFTVPIDMLNRIIAKEPAPTAVNTYVTQLQTSRDALTIPKVNYTTDDIYTTGIRVTWTGEVPSSSTVHRVTDPQFGQLRIPVYTAMLSLPLTNDLIEDSAFPLLSWASGKFSETIDLLRDNMILNGTGVGQPSGLLRGPGLTDEPAIVVSGNATALTADGLIALGFAVPPQYDANARYIFNKNSAGLAIAQLKDSNNRYLWGSGLQDSGLQPDWRNRELLGYPVTYSQFMPNVAAGAFSLIFGDLSGYYLVNRVGFSIQVLRELYAETNQVLLLGRVRFGGVTAEPWRIKVGQVSA